MRLAALLLIAALIPTAASAQILRGVGVKVGVAVSDQNTHYTGDDPRVRYSVVTLPRLGPSVGVFAEWFDLPFISLMTEAGWVRRGYATEHEGRDEFNNPTGVLRITQRFDYATLLALARLRGQGTTGTVFIIAGPRFDLLVGHNEGLGGSQKVWGLVAGLGAELDVPMVGGVSAELRYGRDVTDSNSLDTFETRGHIVEVLLGVRL